VINGSFSTIDRKEYSRILVLVTERIYFLLSMFHNHLNTVIWVI